MNGKGDATRPCDWKRYRANHDEINWNRAETVDRVDSNNPRHRRAITKLILEYQKYLRRYK